MVHVLGVALPDLQLARLALTNFYGIGHKTAQRLCARLQIHDRCKIRDLTAQQITELASIPCLSFYFVRENIAHQRMIGSYVGKRHAMGLPVRGQNTQSNAKTAKKLNRVNRFG
ncbi:hypothetical protein EDD16DRAFT_1882017 [Pisolithus croceorrhizus]|nr:hypothetical protein EDD16DRAFT_1882017 [Pisolithus croceorrhizus]